MSVKPVIALGLALSVAAAMGSAAPACAGTSKPLPPAEAFGAAVMGAINQVTRPLMPPQKKRAANASGSGAARPSAFSQLDPDGSPGTAVATTEDDPFAPKDSQAVPVTSRP